MRGAGVRGKGMRGSDYRPSLTYCSRKSIISSFLLLFLSIFPICSLSCPFFKQSEISVNDQRNELQYFNDTKAFTGIKCPNCYLNQY